jgi:hypothetical protein
MDPVLNPFYNIQAFAKESTRHLSLKRFFTTVFLCNKVSLMPNCKPGGPGFRIYVPWRQGGLLMPPVTW